MPLSRPSALVMSVVTLLVASCGGASGGAGAPAVSPCGAGPSAAGAGGSVIDGLFEASGPTLHLHCAGEGSPAVVFDSGLGTDGTVWRQVQPEIARVTRACVYDRAGNGYSSEPTRSPHTIRRMTGELHALLVAAGIAAPYVLVAHSLAGLNARLYASEHPSEVVGMVLVDVSSDEQDTRYWSLLPAAAMDSFKARLKGLSEGLDYDAVRAAMADVRRVSTSLGPMPLVVLTSGKTESPPPPGVSPELDAQMAGVWKEMQADLARLSSNSVQVVAEHSGHFIHEDAPKLVVASVREVVTAVRAHAPLDGSRLSPLAGEGTGGP